MSGHVEKERHSLESARTSRRLVQSSSSSVIDEVVVFHRVCQHSFALSGPRFPMVRCDARHDCDHSAEHKLFYEDDRGRHAEYYCEEHFEPAIEDTRSDKFVRVVKSGPI